MKHWTQLLGKEYVELQRRAQELIPRATSATEKIMAGDRSEWDTIAGEIDELGVALKAVHLAEASRADQYELCVQEFVS
ncbi:MAG: hypothetical protein ABL921_23350 [Pirellula sp.]